jgi:hypothetical protein
MTDIKMANICSPPLHWHPETVVNQCKHVVRKLFEIAKDMPKKPVLYRNADKLVSIWMSANSLKQLNRFVDVRQPSLLVPPLPDGSNLYHGAVADDPKRSPYFEWKFRRGFIRHLHLPGIWTYQEKPDERFISYGRLYAIGRCLLEHEMKRCQPLDYKHMNLHIFQTPSAKHA